jgi:hypothetical protein
MKAYGGVDIHIHIFLTSAVPAGGWSTPPPHPKERAPGTQWIGSWLRPIFGLDNAVREKILPLLRLELLRGYPKVPKFEFYVSDYEYIKIPIGISPHTLLESVCLASSS